MKAILVWGSIISLILCWAGGALSIYGCLLLWTQRDQPYVQARYPGLVILFVLLLTWDLTIQNTIYILETGLNVFQHQQECKTLILQHI